MKPGGGGYAHVLVDIWCLSIEPHFLHQPYTQKTLFSFSPHPMIPFSQLLYEEVYIKKKKKN